MTYVLGARGRLGSRMCKLLPDAVPMTRADLDLAAPDAVARYFASREPAPIVNCAAYNDVDGAEHDAGTVEAVNATAVGELAAVAAGWGTRLVTFSTDYVFDGTAARPYVESDAVAPLGAYGRSKAHGEQLALRNHPGALVVRTSWLMSGTGGDFVAKILDAARSGPVRVVDDRFGSPTLASDLAAAAYAAMRSAATGLLHLANRGSASRHELATMVVRLAGMDPALVVAAASAPAAEGAERPVRSDLESERRAELGLSPMRHWREAVPEAVLAWLGVRDGEARRTPPHPGGSSP